MKICDLTQFYSPLSGGVKRYLHEKIAYVQSGTAHEHVLVVPGAKTECIAAERSRIYTIRSPIVSRSAQYRALLNLRAIEQIVARERPDLIESGDPYQVGWKAIATGNALGIPVFGFYHSHFTEAYVRGVARFAGNAGATTIIKLAQRYVRNLYNRFQATLVPSEPLAHLLHHWGVSNVRVVTLGVNTEVFTPSPDDSATTRARLRVPPSRRLLLYVGRLAPEKNTRTLFRAFDLLSEAKPNAFHLLVIGDGPQRADLVQLRARRSNVSWIPYCSDAGELARYYRAGDLFVHPGIEETFGLVALESQACSTPIVGILGTYMDRNILHEQGSWAQENTPESLARAIEATCEGDLPALGAGAAQDVQQRFAWPHVFEQLFSIYSEACAGYKGRN